MPLGLALTLCGLGCAFLIPAAIFWILKKKHEKNCTEEATAVVIAVHSRNYGDSPSLHPEYEYFVDGERYTNTGGYWQRHVPHKGDEVQIRYNPNRPQQSYIMNYDLVVYKRLSILFGIFGMIPVVICVAIAISASL